MKINGTVTQYLDDQEDSQQWLLVYEWSNVSILFCGIFNGLQQHLSHNILESYKGLEINQQLQPVGIIKL